MFSRTCACFFRVFWCHFIQVVLIDGSSMSFGHKDTPYDVRTCSCRLNSLYTHEIRFLNKIFRKIYKYYCTHIKRRVYNISRYCCYKILRCICKRICKKMIIINQNIKTRQMFLRKKVPTLFLTHYWCKLICHLRSFPGMTK